MGVTAVGMMGCWPARSAGKYLENLQVEVDRKIGTNEVKIERGFGLQKTTLVRDQLRAVLWFSDVGEFEVDASSSPSRAKVGSEVSVRVRGRSSQAEGRRSKFALPEPVLVGVGRC